MAKGKRPERSKSEQRIIDSCLTASLRLDQDKFLKLIHRTEKKSFRNGLKAAIAVVDSALAKADGDVRDAERKKKEIGAAFNFGFLADAEDRYETTIKISTALRTLLKWQE